MNQNFYDKLESFLKKDTRFLDQDGEILKTAVIDKSYKADKKLVEILLSDKQFKDKFFSKVRDVFVFNINDFVSYIQDKNFLANSYTKYQNKIGLNIDGKFLSERNEVALVWPFKDCVLEGGMTEEDEKRKEVFFNEILAQDEIDRLFAPKVLTNWKRYSSDVIPVKTGIQLKRDQSGTIRENLIIRGNNLLALHSLKQQFQGKIKLIYIDPPYNTGGSQETFTYNNNFNHSTWLIFMKNRLGIARDLLREDGFIAIAIDHAELFYLGELSDEVFGRENRLGIISIVNQARGRWMDKNFSASNDFMLVYSKKYGTNIRNVVIDKKKKDMFNLQDEKGNYCLKNYIVIQGGGGGVTREDKPNFWYPIYVSKDLKQVSLKKKSGYEGVLPISDSGRELTWITVPETFLSRFNEGEIVIKREKGKVVIYRKFREQQIIPTHWIDPKYNSTSYGTLLLEKIIGRKDFSYPKSLYTIIDTLKLMTAEDDIILDFFAGSGTTGHATLELNKEDGGNRKFILVEQLDKHIKICKERIQKVIKNLAKDKKFINGKEKLDFIYCELMRYNELFVEKIQKAKTTKELLKIWGEMKEKSFLNYNVDIKKFDETIDEFNELPPDKQKRILFSFLNKNQLYINLSEIKDKDYKISGEDKKMNGEFYG